MTALVQAGSVFQDTSAYLAVTDARDTNHNAALTIYRRLTVERTLQVTSNLILAEMRALVLTRLGRDVATRVLFSLDDSATMITRATEGNEQNARSIISRYQDKNFFSLTDATSFANMERLGIASAFSFDRNFAALASHSPRQTNIHMASVCSSPINPIL